MPNLNYKPASELAALIRDRSIKSADLVEQHLAQIAKHNPSLNAFVLVLEQQARDAAAACDRETEAGRSRGPLHGVPISIKEQFWVKGTRSTLNFKMLKDWTAEEDADIVTRLRAAGAVVLGKTNVPLNLIDYQVQGDLYPEGKNPYRPDYSPGGSTGGGAAALASGMTSLELGGDFGGSIRCPANFCGLFGLKPTDGTISGHGNGPVPKSVKGQVWHMAQAGPLARSPEDLELMWKLIRGPGQFDRSVPRIEWPTPAGKSLRDYRIAWVDSWPGYDASEQTRKSIGAFVSALRELGCSVVEAKPADELHARSLSLFVRLFPQIITQGMPWFIKPLVKRSLKKGLLRGVSRDMGELDEGFKGGMANYAETLAIRGAVIAEWERFFSHCDLLVCPSSHSPAFKRCKIGTELEYDGKRLTYMDHTWPYLACFNASGHPAMNIPLGLGKEGLPLGVQVVGPYWSEPELLHFGKLAGAATPGFVRPGGFEPS